MLCFVSYLFFHHPKESGNNCHTDHIHRTRSALDSDGTDRQDSSPSIDRVCPHVLDRGIVLILRLALECLLHVFDLLFGLDLAIGTMPEEGLERFVFTPVLEEPPGRLGYE